MLECKIKKNNRKTRHQTQKRFYFSSNQSFFVKTQFFLLKYGIILINLLLLHQKLNKRGVRSNQTLTLRSYKIYKIELQNQKKGLERFLLLLCLTDRFSHIYY